MPTSVETIGLHRRAPLSNKECCRYEYLDTRVSTPHPLNSRPIRVFSEDLQESKALNRQPLANKLGEIQEIKRKALQVLASKKQAVMRKRIS